MNEQEFMTQIYRVFHPSLPRLGPGDSRSTLRALELIPREIRRPDRCILDLGCGNGTQTVCLAGELPGEIFAVDTHQPFLDRLMIRAKEAGCSERIHPLCMDMAAIDPENGRFDLIWCESAIYNMGFERGLRHCRTLLDGGYLALSEMNWLGEERPQACRDFFDRLHLPVSDIAENLEIITKTGFETLGHFVLPESSWWDEFYTPLSLRLEELQHSFPDDEDLKEVIGNIVEEIELFRQYSGIYGYVFYVLKN